MQSNGSGNVFVADFHNNAVKEIPSGCVTSSCVNPLGSGFSYPAGVAVDGSGNVFVADTFNNAVKEILATGGYVTVNQLSTYFNKPYGVAVDGSGNVFVADTEDMSVREILASSGYTTVNLLGNFGDPMGVAVDGSGNVFVADTDNNSVEELLATSGYATDNTLGSGFSMPYGVAVDRSGNVFVADQAHDAVKEILVAGGYTTVVTLDNGLSSPCDVAVDGNGNVFVSDSGNNQVLKLETASVDFGTVAIGQTSAAIPLIFTFDSGGVIGNPAVFTEGVAGLDFAAPGQNSCEQGMSYSAGTTCTMYVTFTPRLAGLRSGGVILTNGAGNTIATAYVHGIGSGPQVSFLPGSQSTLGSGFSFPIGVAVDGSGNVFVADASNDAVKEILAAGGYTTVNTLGSGFHQPFGVALDKSGNVFVADTSNNAVKEILATGGYATVLTIPSSFNEPQGIAVDGSGNVFVTDVGDNTVKEVLAAGGYATINTLGSNFDLPSGVAVDGSGNVFVSNCLNNAVQEILAASGYATMITVGSGFNCPSGIAVDGSGNLFVTDGSSAVKEVLAAGGYTTVITLAGGFLYPNGTAMDGSGNVFVAESGKNRILKLDYADPPSLTFATPAQVGSTDTTDGPQTVTVQNIGNVPLTFQPFVAANLLDAVLASPGATDCTELSGSQLAPGAACTLAIEFDPAQSGPVNGYVNLVDNALNPAPPSYATQTIALQGTGLVAAQTITFPNPGGQKYGVAPLLLKATASSGLPLSYAVISGPATVSGSNLTITGAGSVTVQAGQTGNGTYAAAAPVNQTFMVTQASLTVTANDAAWQLGAASPRLTYTITGFVNADTSAVVSGTASLTTTATATSAVGTYPITFSTKSLTAANYTFRYTSGTLTVYSTTSPIIVELSSSAATAGGAGFTLTVNGANFASKSVVLWNGAVRKTTYVSAAQLTAAIGAADIAKEKTNLVTVANPAPNPATAAAMPFVVMSSAPVATITGGSLAATADGSGNRLLTLAGRDFLPSSTVRWNGASLATTDVSPWQISAVLPASGYSSLPAVVTVQNPAGASVGFEAQ